MDSGDYGSRLLPHHQELLRASAVGIEVARERNYVSVEEKTRLERAGFSRRQRRVPGLLIPIHDVHGDVVLHQYRPDVPGMDTRLYAFE